MLITAASKNASKSSNDEKYFTFGRLAYKRGFVLNSNELFLNVSTVATVVSRSHTSNPDHNPFFHVYCRKWIGSHTASVWIFVSINGEMVIVSIIWLDYDFPPTPAEEREVFQDGGGGAFASSREWGG